MNTSYSKQWNSCQPINCILDAFSLYLNIALLGTLLKVHIGNQINERHLEYVKRYHLYDEFFIQKRDDYLINYIDESYPIKNLSIDTSIINNKNCSELIKHLLYNKNRSGKIESIKMIS